MEFKSPIATRVKLPCPYLSVNINTDRLYYDKLWRKNRLIDSVTQHYLVVGLHIYTSIQQRFIDTIRILGERPKKLCNFAN